MQLPLPLQLQRQRQPAGIARITPLAMAQNGTTLEGINILVSGTRTAAHKLEILTETIIAKAKEVRMSMTERPVTKLTVHVAAAMNKPAHQPTRLRLELLTRRPKELHPQRLWIAMITPLAMVKIGTTLEGIIILASGTRTIAHKLEILTETIIAKATEIRMSMTERPVTKLAVHVAAAMSTPTHQPKHLLNSLPHRLLPPQMRQL